MKVLELFSGYGSQALALKYLGINFTSDISEIDKYAIQAYKQLHGPTYNYGDICKIDETKLPYYDLITYSSPCFTADNLVLTENEGYKKIIDIQEGESVLTHDGSYKPVEKVINNGIKSTIKICGMGFDEIRTTENHKFYVREKLRVWDNSRRSYKRMFSKPIWKKAQDLTRNDYLGFPINQKSIVPEWCGITFNWSDGRSDRHKNQLSGYMNNYNFWWLIGRYVADGYCRTNSGIIITCGKKKINELKSIADKLNLNYSISVDRTVYRISYSLKELELFVKSFGKYAHGKKIPGFVIDLPIDLLKGFLEGYMAGDGCFTNNKFKATSVSRELIYGLAQCVVKVYKRPFSIYKTTRPITKVIEGRIVNQKDTYEITFKKENHIQDKAFYENGFIWFPFNKKEKANDEVVYDLTVRDNHSFIVNNTIVHNCQDFSTGGLRKGGDVDSGTRSSLLWQCERIIRAVKPKYLLMENVKGLLSNKHKHNFDKWLEILESLGYQNFWKVLNAKDYGIPQNRERIFVVSILGNENYIFPDKFDCKTQLKDILESQVDEKYYITEQYENYIRNKETKQHHFRVEISDPNGIRKTPLRAAGDRACVKDGIRIRRLTPKECWKLMGVKDDDFNKLHDISHHQLYKLSGNSIVVNVLMEIFKNLLCK